MRIDIIYILRMLRGDKTGISWITDLNLIKS